MAHTGINILTFISEKNRYFKCLHKSWNKIISFDMRKKGKLSKIGHGKNEGKGEFESPRSESLMFQSGYPNHAWTHQYTIKN
jgi:hypothetical protein